jgi:Flp pilus assembly protein TadG
MASLRKILRRGWRCESGAEFVEAALAIPLLLLVVLGIMDFGLMFQQYEVLTNAAREGARVAVLPTYQANLQTNVSARVNQYVTAAFLASGGAVTVDPVVVTTGVALPGSPCRMTTYQVKVRYTHQFFFLAGIGKYFGANFGTKQLTASSTMRSEIPGTGC